jgi:hypothetical protein
MQVAKIHHLCGERMIIMPNTKRKQMMAPKYTGPAKKGCDPQ